MGNRAGLDARWRSFARDPFLVTGGGVTLGLFLVALLAPWLAPWDVDHVDVRRQLEGPSTNHWFGTDESGRDLCTLVLFGARTALLVGSLSVLVSLSVGVAVGGIAGFRGGRVDELFMRLTDVVLAFPGILLAILIIFVTQAPSLWSVVLALSVTGWAGYARILRAEVLALRQRDFVEAAFALGLPPVRIFTVHLLPNTFGPMMVQATFGVAGAILAEASLSFLGLGPQDVPSWGALLDQGATYFLLTPHLAIFPGIAIMVTVLGINLLGDGLRDALDPRLRHGAPTRRATRT
ncbi:MAG: ABC transporter permease [Deltaproteobacteria bacterium]|nr:MAG: ABC transporter permease [Deltaproteobacteria bacterium]